MARRVAGKPGTSVTLGLLRGPYRGEIEITITRRLIAKIPLQGPNLCPFLYPYADISKGASLRLRESPPDDGERLADQSRGADAAGANDPHEHPHEQHLSPVGSCQQRGGAREQVLAAGEGRRDARILDPSSSGVSSRGAARAQCGDEELRPRGDAGEGDEWEGREAGGRILMADLQRDPWADPPLESEMNPVYPERWGAGGSFSAGWGRASVGGAGGAGIAERIAISASDAAPLAPPPPSSGQGATGWPGQGVSENGEVHGQLLTGQIGPTTQPLSEAARAADCESERHPSAAFSSRTGSDLGGSMGGLAAGGVGQDRGDDSGIAPTAAQPAFVPGSAIRAALGSDRGHSSAGGETQDSPTQVDSRANGREDALCKDDHEQESRERERRRARARAREVAAASSAAEGLGFSSAAEGAGGDGVKAMQFDSPHSPPTPASS